MRPWPASLPEVDPIRIDGQREIAAVIHEKQRFEVPSSTTQHSCLSEGLFHWRRLVAILEHPGAGRRRGVEHLNQRPVRAYRRVEDDVETCKGNGAFADGGHESPL